MPTPTQATRQPAPAEEPLDPLEGEPEGTGRREYRHSPLSVSMAKHFGMTDDEIAETSPAALEKSLIVLHRREAVTPRGRDPEPERRAAPPPEPEVELDWGDEDDGVDEKGNQKKRKLTDEDIYPPLARVLKAQAKQQKKLEAYLVEREREREARRVQDALDDAYASLGEKFEKRVGSGGYGDLPADSPERAKRDAIFTAARIDFSKSPSPAQIRAAIKKAAKLVFDDEPARAGRDSQVGADDLDAPPPRRQRAAVDADTDLDDELDDRRKKWEEHGPVAKPTQRANADNTKGDQAAKAAARAGLKKMGLPTDANVRSAEDQDALDSLPD